MKATIEDAKKNVNTQDNTKSNANKSEVKDDKVQKSIDKKLN